MTWRVATMVVVRSKGLENGFRKLAEETFFKFREWRRCATDPDLPRADAVQREMKDEGRLARKQRERDAVSAGAVEGSRCDLNVDAIDADGCAGYQSAQRILKCRKANVHVKIGACELRP